LDLESHSATKQSLIDDGTLLVATSEDQMSFEYSDLMKLSSSLGLSASTCVEMASRLRFFVEEATTSDHAFVSVVKGIEISHGDYCLSSNRRGEVQQRQSKSHKNSTHFRTVEVIGVQDGL
jgi:hypothetical protein